VDFAFAFMYNYAMEINKTIFKSYDIRGIFPSELDEEQAFAIGQAFAKMSGAKRVVVGQDARLGSPMLFRALAKGISAAGAKVFDVGQVPTECLYFAVGNYDFDSGVMITASHNPKEYDGFKMMRKTNGQIEIIRGVDLLSAAELETIKSKKEIEEIDFPEEEFDRAGFWNDFSRHVLSFAELDNILPLKVVVDASNGVAGNAIVKFQDNLPAEIIPLNFKPDGNFPNHSPNPLMEGSTDQISELIKKENADFGLMFDGDADRIFLADENGELVSADITLLLLAKYFLQKNPGMAIAYNAICSKAVPESIKKWGGNPVRTKVGFVNVREGLLENNGIMGGELSGHYCFKDNYYMDSGMISLLALLQIFSKDQRKVSEIAKELSPYFKSAESNFKIKNKDAVLEKVKAKYSDGQQDFLDGVTVEYKDWWFNIRPSNTEPLLRLTIEAETKELLAKKQKELAKLIK
jgi:phosphomannomutase